MNPISVETILILLITAYVLSGGIFIFSQRQGQTYIASFDRAIAWGGSLFVIGNCLDAVAYVTWV
jgi:hypothetical protein